MMIGRWPTSWRPGRTVNLSTTLRPWPPYITERIKRFGEYPIDGLDMPPEAYDLHLALLAATAVQAA
jgi:hypothetical protein